jgi:mono/diheme cytochrome c family protein
MRPFIRIGDRKNAPAKNCSLRAALFSWRKWLVVLASFLISTHFLVGTASCEVQRAEAEEMRAHCESCHDRGMIIQQRLTPEQWQAEVKKMQKWGAGVPADQEKSLVDYLSGQFKAGAVPMSAPESSSATLLDSVKPLTDPVRFHGDAHAGQGVYTDACGECHGPDARGKQGPNLVQQPILYRFNDFQEIVMRGRRTMPAFSGVLDRKQLENLVAWLRTQRIN